MFGESLRFTPSHLEKHFVSLIAPATEGPTVKRKGGILKEAISTVKEKETAPQEAELKFAVLKSNLDTTILTKKEVSQSYFPKEELDAVLGYVAQEHPDFVAGIDREECKNARVRIATIGKETSYYFTIKSPRDEHTKSKTEHEIHISKDLYEQLLPLATIGHVDKNRYLLPGTIRSAGKDIPVTMEIDDVQNVSGDDFSDMDFCIAEIEFTNPDQLLKFQKEYKGGKHTFPFLAYSLDITNERLLSMRQLAKRGRNDEVEQLIEKITRKLK